MTVKHNCFSINTRKVYLIYGCFTSIYTFGARGQGLEINGLMRTSEPRRNILWNTSVSAFSRKEKKDWLKLCFSNSKFVFFFLLVTFPAVGYMHCLCYRYTDSRSSYWVAEIIQVKRLGFLALQFWLLLL